MLGFPAASRFLALIPAAAILAAAQTAPAPPSHDATTHHPFRNVDEWVKVFDDPHRDSWQKPAAVVEALGLRAGMIVADIGAGTGYFNQHLSRAVAPKGIVFAVDTEPEMVVHMGVRALSEKTANVVPVLALPEDPFLPPGRIDRILIVDTYHHIDNRLDYFRRLKPALAPGGRVAVVDYHKRPLPVGPPPEHKLDRAFVIEEMKEAGWILSDEKTFLPYQYFLLFQPAGT
jgi:predicted methyltransferase